MLVLLSPAKTMAFDRPRPQLKGRTPHFQQQANGLVDVLKKQSAAKLAKTLSVSDKLAQLNAERFKAFADKPNAKNSDLAIVAYQGDVYQGLDAASLNDADLQYGDAHIGMLSGLYGVVQPLDLIQPYRLEMSTKLAVDGHKDLYGFWGDAITQHLNALVKKHKHKAVINCASQEYFKAVQPGNLSVPLIQCDFKEMKNGKPVIVALFAKKARGMLARYAVQNRLTDPSDLRGLDLGGYKLDKKLSTPENFVFCR